ncbi:MAG: phage regulatory CII family protein [Pseudomonadota bacterium]
MDLDDAIYRVVHDYPGGVAKLAALSGLNAGTLYNKANPGMESHNLSVKEAVALQNSANDCRILYAEAAALNHCCIPIADFTGISDVELLTSYASWHAEIGETAQAVRDALSDGRITRRELDRVKYEIHQDIQRAFEFASRLEALLDE